MGQNFEPITNEIDLGLLRAKKYGATVKSDKNKGMEEAFFKTFTGITGPRLSLTKLSAADSAELYQSLFSPTTWSVAVRKISDESTFVKYIEDFLVKQNRGESLTLVARVTETGKVAAMSTFWNYSPNGTKIEIGFTWVADQWMRTFVNTEMKLLMLSQAFEKFKVKRVEFSVDPSNDKSNMSMKRLGIVFEGTLRKWRFLSPDDKGDRHIYSVTDDEWPKLKNHIEKNCVR